MFSDLDYLNSEIHRKEMLKQFEAARLIRRAHQASAGVVTRVLAGALNNLRRGGEWILVQASRMACMVANLLASAAAGIAASRVDQCFTRGKALRRR